MSKSPNFTARQMAIREAGSNRMNLMHRFCVCCNTTYPDATVGYCFGEEPRFFVELSDAEAMSEEMQILADLDADDPNEFYYFVKPIDQEEL